MGDRGTSRHEIAQRLAQAERDVDGADNPLDRLLAIQAKVDLRAELAALDEPPAPVRWTQTELACAVCGGAIVQPSGAGRPRVTCSDACRAKRARARRRQWAKAAGR